MQEDLQVPVKSVGFGAGNGQSTMARIETKFSCHSIASPNWTISSSASPRILPWLSRRTARPGTSLDCPGVRPHLRYRNGYTSKTSG